VNQTKNAGPFPLEKAPRFKISFQTGEGGKKMPLNRQNQNEYEKLPQKQKPTSESTPKTNALDDPEALAAIIKGLLNGRLE
jgi:hypothetical protein